MCNWDTTTVIAYLVDWYVTYDLSLSVGLVGSKIGILVVLLMHHFGYCFEHIMAHCLCVPSNYYLNTSLVS